MQVREHVLTHHSYSHLPIVHSSTCPSTHLSIHLHVPSVHPSIY